VFAGSGGWPFIDPAGRFLVLRDAAVVLLFDYETGEAWSMVTVQRKGDPVAAAPKVGGAYLEFGFENGAVVVDSGGAGLKVRPEEFGTLFVRGLALAADGCMSHWREAGWTQRARDGEKSWLLTGRYQG
jgi:hypothetical protein